MDKALEKLLGHLVSLWNIPAVRCAVSLAKAGPLRLVAGPRQGIGARLAWCVQKLSMDNKACLDRSFVLIDHL